jgi:hypothetical protein
MGETLPLCDECNKPISVADAVWHQPFAFTRPTDNPNVSKSYGEVSTRNNGGIPLHRACFKGRHPEIPVPD